MWVRNAIRANQLKFVPGDRAFPRRVWFESRDRIWYGRCTDPAAGEYKGWPICEEDRDEIFG